MGFNQKQYNMGRTRGLELAYEIYKDKGIDALKEDVAFRLDTDINTGSRTERIDKYSDGMKMCTWESVGVMAINILRDEFDFGKVRCERFLNEWTKEQEKYKETNLVDWWKDMKNIRKIMELDIICDAIDRKKPSFKKNNYEEGRDAAFEMVLKMAEKGDEQGIKELLKFRSKMRINPTIHEKNCEEAVERVKDLCYQFILYKTMETMNKIFGFGRERLQRFVDRWDLKSDCLMVDLVSWKDLTWVVLEEIGLKVDLPYMETEGWVYHPAEKEVL